MCPHFQDLLATIIYNIIATIHIDSLVFVLIHPRNKASAVCLHLFITYIFSKCVWFHGIAVNLV